MSTIDLINSLRALNLADWADIATLSGIFVAILALYYTGRQVRENTRISRGHFWLELEKMFSQHDEIHIKLRPGGVWTHPGAGPQSVEDWAKVEDYMGLFEHCELMLRKGLLDSDTFRLIFSYRLYNIISNRIIVDAKLKKERDSWEAFIRLLKHMRIPIPS